MTEPSNTIDISPRVCGNILRRYDDDPVEETALDERVIVTEDLRFDERFGQRSTVVLAFDTKSDDASELLPGEYDVNFLGPEPHFRSGIGILGSQDGGSCVSESVALLYGRLALWHLVGVQPIGILTFDALNGGQSRSTSSNQYMQIDPRRHRSHDLVVAMPGIHGGFDRHEAGA